MAMADSGKVVVGQLVACMNSCVIILLLNIMAGHLCLFVANVGSLKDEEVACSIAMTTSVHTRQAASVASSLAEFQLSSVSSHASSRLSKLEEKAEVTPAVKPGKRQKRLRNQQECISLDRDEKRASVITPYNVCLTVF